MFSCDYNGWADVPEEEREGIDAFELTLSVERVQLWMPLLIEASPLRLQEVPERRAA